jgi:hypothetical protein
MKHIWLNRFKNYWSYKFGIKIDSAEYKSILEWMEEWIEDAELYVHAKRTAHAESFHSLAIKYYPKGVRWCFNTYKMRKNLALIHWNENFNKSSKSRTFRRTIIKIYEDMQNNSSKNSGNSS